MTDPVSPEPFESRPPGEPRDDATARYRLQPETGQWGASDAGSAERGTPERWIEPESTAVARGTTTYSAGQLPHAAPAPVVAPRPRRGGLIGPLLAVGLLSAVLASGGTYLTLEAAGAFDDPTPAPIQAQPPAVTTGTQRGPVTIQEQSAITAAAEAVSPAVVTITVGGGEPDSFLQIPSTGVGSGIIYAASGDTGYILTNRHVVAGAEDVRVALQDGRVFDGETYGIDTLTDLAIVTIMGDEDLPVAQIGDSSALKPGQLAVAIGSPLGTFTNSVTSGIVSAMGRDITVNDEETGEPRPLRNLIQTDAAINPGNSGGALVDSQGQVIGVNTAVAGDAQGIGFAIPINIAKPIMNQAVAGEELARPWMGFYYTEIDLVVQEAEELPVDYGILVQAPQGSTQPAVLAGSPADDAGLQEGDIILEVNDQKLDSAHALDELLTQYAPEEELTLSILRDNEPLDLEVKLGTRPAGRS